MQGTVSPIGAPVHTGAVRNNLDAREETIDSETADGHITIFTFNNPKVVRIIPTLVIAEKEVKKILDACDKAMDAASKLV